MKKTIVAVLFSCAAAIAFAQDGKPVPVTVDNFVRAELDMYMASALKHSGGLAKFHHIREVASADKQNVIRTNRDTTS